MRLEFHPEAERELVEAADYYEMQVSGLGARLAREVVHATEVLLKRTEIGAPTGSAIRKLTLNRFPYTLYYSVTLDCIRIEAVAHQRRRPGFWQERLGR